MDRFTEIDELLEVAYIGRNVARDEDEVRHWEGQIEELEAERDEIIMEEFGSDLGSAITKGLKSGAVTIGI